MQIVQIIPDWKTVSIMVEMGGGKAFPVELLMALFVLFVFGGGADAQYWGFYQYTVITRVKILQYSLQGWETNREKQRQKTEGRRP